MHMMIIYGENTNVLQGQVHLSVAATNETLYNNKNEEYSSEVSIQQILCIFLYLLKKSLQRRIDALSKEGCTIPAGTVSLFTVNFCLCPSQVIIALLGTKGRIKK